MYTYIKCQSLGNDFIFFDGRNQKLHLLNDSAWPQMVRIWCDRTIGIGADGILTLEGTKSLRARIFNADGTEAELCLNGLRCIAHYLFEQGQAQPLSISMGNQTIISRCTDRHIEQQLMRPIYQGHTSITIKEMGIEISGHVVDAGNPHFIVLEKKDFSWVKYYGEAIAIHPTFPRGTNVHFVWTQDSNAYHMISYERGCGVTGACSSGAAAVSSLLVQIREAKREITIHMPKGIVSISCGTNHVALRGEASLISRGSIKKDTGMERFTPLHARNSHS